METVKNQNYIHVWLKDGSTLMLYDVLEIRAYDALETDIDFSTKKEFMSHHVFTIKVGVDEEAKTNGIFYIRSLSPKTPVIKVNDEPGLTGLGKLCKP